MVKKENRAAFWLGLFALIVAIIALVIVIAGNMTGNAIFNKTSVQHKSFFMRLGDSFKSKSSAPIATQLNIANIKTLIFTDFSKFKGECQNFNEAEMGLGNALNGAINWGIDSPSSEQGSGDDDDTPPEDEGSSSGGEEDGGDTIIIIVCGENPITYSLRGTQLTRTFNSQTIRLN